MILRHEFETESLNSYALFLKKRTINLWLIKCPLAASSMGPTHHTFSILVYTVYQIPMEMLNRLVENLYFHLIGWIAHWLGNNIFIKISHMISIKILHNLWIISYKASVMNKYLPTTVVTYSMLSTTNLMLHLISYAPNRLIAWLDRRQFSNFGDSTLVERTVDDLFTFFLKVKISERPYT